MNYELGIKKNVIAFFVLIIIDQISKYLIRHTGGFYICNKGIAFGIKLPNFIWVIIIILAIAVFLIIINFKFKILNEIKINKFKNLKLIENSKFKIKNFQHKYFIHDTLYIILILSGALGNLIDRLYFGCVIDFIDLKFWPVFNLADVFIVMGAIIVIIKIFKLKTKN